ncbi:MAG TPA: SAM-dependent methyltransferase [Bacteroidia bacterium]|nr:SAM-dependent methyltransferase [Bacteroidia bacterium]
MTPSSDSLAEAAPVPDCPPASHQTQFLKAFFRNAGQVGAIAPSSSGLSSVLADTLDWDNLGCLVEYGPGTGSVTAMIVDRLREGTRFFAIERDPVFATTTRGRFPGVEVVEDCVTRVPEICRERGIGQVDAILSGLPWASFPPDLQDRALEAMFEILPPGGRFATFAYLQGLLLPAGQRFRRFLEGNFSSVSRSRVVWRNLPPAFVYQCVR